MELGSQKGAGRENDAADGGRRCVVTIAGVNGGLYRRGVIVDTIAGSAKIGNGKGQRIAGKLDFRI